MGCGPTHNCTVPYEGEELPIVMPGSTLDCDRPACKRRAEIAERGTFWNLDYIEKQIADAQDQVRIAMDMVSLWELVREAKTRVSAT